MQTIQHPCAGRNNVLHPCATDDRAPMCSDIRASGAPLCDRETIELCAHPCADCSNDSDDEKEPCLQCDPLGIRFEGPINVGDFLGE